MIDEVRKERSPGIKLLLAILIAFVPLIPLKVLGQRVRCQGCGTELSPSVLTTHGIEQSVR